MFILAEKSILLSIGWMQSTIETMGIQALHRSADKRSRKLMYPQRPIHIQRSGRRSGSSSGAGPVCCQMPLCPPACPRRHKSDPHGACRRPAGWTCRRPVRWCHSKRLQNCFPGMIVARRHSSQRYQRLIGGPPLLDDNGRVFIFRAVVPTGMRPRSPEPLYAHNLTGLLFLLCVRDHAGEGVQRLVPYFLKRTQRICPIVTSISRELDVSLVVICADVIVPTYGRKIFCPTLQSGASLRAISMLVH